MPRLFVAIRPPAAIRAQLLAIQGGVDGARWQDEDQLHLTLRFIGEVDRRVAHDVAAALATVHIPTFDLALNGVGRFERKGRVETLWAGVTPHDVVRSLHKKVDQVLMRTGLAPDGRAYRPHITLARGRMGAGCDGFGARNAALTSAAFPVAHFALFESTLGTGGANYAVVERWRLG